MIPSLIEYENIGSTVMSSTYIFNDDEESSHIRLRQCDHHALSLILPVNSVKEMEIRVQSKRQQHHFFSSNSLRNKFVCTNEAIREKLDTKSENDYDAKPSLVRKSLDLESYRKVDSRQQAFECLRRLDNSYDMHNNDVNDISTNAAPHSRAKSSKNTDGGNNDNNNISGTGKTGRQVSKELQKMKLIRKRSSEIRRDLFAGNRESSVTNFSLDY